jgi:hypothetical protein
MEHDKDLELKLLKSISSAGRIFSDEFRNLFGKDWPDFDVVFKRMIVQPEPGLIKEMNLTDISKPGYYYEITPKGKLRIKVLQKEWDGEAAEYILRNKDRIESSSRTFWTVVIGIGTLLILAGTIWLIVLEKHKNHETPTETHSVVIPIPDTAVKH